MNFIFDILPAILVILIIAAICVLSRFSKKEAQFDERQELIRGRAYRLGFLTLIIALVICLICHTMLDSTLSYFAFALCLVLGLSVFAVYSIWHDAFFSFQQKPGSYLLLCAVAIVSNALAIGTHLRDGMTLVEMFHGVYSQNLLFVLTFLVIAVTLVLRICLTRKEED